MALMNNIAWVLVIIFGGMFLYFIFIPWVKMQLSLFILLFRIRKLRKRLKLKHEADKKVFNDIEKSIIDTIKSEKL